MDRFEALSEEGSNPAIDAQRADTHQSVWERVGNAIRGTVDTGGKITRWGTDVGATGTHHVREASGPAGEIIGNLVRGTGEFVAGIIRGVHRKK